MTSLIKSGAFADLSAVKPLKTSVSVAPRTAEAEEADRQRARIAELEGSLKQAGLDITGLRAELEQNYRQGHDDGTAAGIAEAQDQQAERLTLLGKAVSQAGANVREGIEVMERMAIVLARDCLEIMLGDPGERSALVAGLIHKQIGQIDRTTLLRVEVSPVDFPDETALSALCADAGLDERVIVARSQMPAGACTMVLELGQTEIGLGQQWGTLRRALGDMAGAETAP